MRGHRIEDVQGRFLGLPYDWRRPTWAKVARRLWNPGGPLFSPKTFGWGYTLNLAHPATKWLELAARTGTGEGGDDGGR